MTIFAQYDPTDPPPEGIPANPLPDMFDEGDEEDTLTADDYLPIDPTIWQRLRWRVLSTGMNTK